MSKIKCFALGGLDELGKNLLILEVDNKIFIFDCGLKTLKNLDLGTNTLIPDFNYLLNNRHRIQGVFITKMDKEHAYALPFLLKSIPNLKIYTSQITSIILKSLNLLSSKQIKDNLFIFNKTSIRFENNQMHFFTTASNLPGSSGFTLETADGFVVYTGAFVLDNGLDQNFFTTELDQILPHRNKPVLLLISSCANLNNMSFTTPYNQVQPWIDRAWQQSKRNLIVCCDQNDWFKIFSTIYFLQKTTKEKFELTFLDEQWGQKIINIFNEFGPKKSIFDYVSIKNLSPKTRKLIFVTGDEKRLFSRILRLPNLTNPHLRLSNDDMLLILGKNPFSSELIVSKSLDVLWRQDVPVKFVSNTKLFQTEAGFYDLKLLIGFLKPKYLFPFNAYHKDLRKMYTLVDKIGMKPEQVCLQENGEVVTFLNGKKQNEYEALFVESVFVDNLLNKNVLDSVINERKSLGEEGIIFIFLSCFAKKERLYLNQQLSFQSFGFSDDKIKLEDILKNLENTTVNFFKKTKWSNDQQEAFTFLLKKRFAFIVKKIINKNPFIFPLLVIDATL